MQSVLEDSEIENNNVHETIISEVPPWILRSPKVLLNLSDLSKGHTVSSFYSEVQ